MTTTPTAPRRRPAQHRNDETALRPLRPGDVVPVSGISFRQDVARTCYVGDEVLLTHEVSNRYDANAVLITTSDGRELGYVPSTGRLNERLLLNHRGGMWAGAVADRLDGETIGLRVSINRLIGHKDPTYGSDKQGIRDTDYVRENTQQTPTSAASAASAAPEPTDTQEVQETEQAAYTRHGRRLGKVVENTGNKVRVCTDSGRVVSYPADIVLIR